MLRVSIITDSKIPLEKLDAELKNEGLVCSIDPDGQSTARSISAHELDLVFLALDGQPFNQEIVDLAHHIKREDHLPLIALLSREAMNKLDASLDIDDFVVEPWDANEIVIRARRVMDKNANALDPEVMRCGNMTINLAKYEVRINNKPVELTFKEYELLRFLAKNKGRVFTREALLNEVWGYEYYGGDRTVDVHITRLRSKIETPTSNTFIETVRNIGYRFKENL